MDENKKQELFSLLTHFPPTDKKGLNVAISLIKQGAFEKAADICETFITHPQLTLNDLIIMIDILGATEREVAAKEAYDNSLRYLRRYEKRLTMSFDPASISALGDNVELEEVESMYQGVFKRCFDYLGASRINGPVLEFGTFMGYTARIIATLMKEIPYPQAELILYDSFEGLPDPISAPDKGSYQVAQHRLWTRGQLMVLPHTPTRIKHTINQLIEPSRLKIVKGFFEDSLLNNLPNSPVAMVHLDCDFYSSTKYVLQELLNHQLLQDGCILVFDDYNCNRANPDMGERRALQEILEEQSRYKVSPFFSYSWHGQAFFVHDSQVDLFI